MIETAAQFAERVVSALASEVSVALDALLQAGWPVSRIVQLRDGSYDPVDFETIAVVLLRGTEFADDLRVFEAGASMDPSDTAIKISARWLVDPIPTPHASTIAKANPAPRPTRCDACDSDIDTESCWCGDPIDHGAWEHGRSPVPMGCVCHLQYGP